MNWNKDNFSGNESGMTHDTVSDHNGELRQGYRFDSTPTQLEQGLVGHWPLHTDGGTAPDLSGNGNHGSVTGTTRVSGKGGLTGK